MTAATWAVELTTIKLGKGSHDDLDEGACLLELCSFLAREPWSDHPDCVSPILGAFGRNLNDALPDDLRQQLTPFAPRMLNTKGDGLDERRGYMALDWLIRTYTPAWLRLVPSLTPTAGLLAAAHEIVDLESAARVGESVRAAAGKAAAARSAAGSAAGSAARSAAWDAAWSAAWSAAWDALAPPVTELQQSAISLLDRMILPAATS